MFLFVSRHADAEIVKDVIADLGEYQIGGQRIVDLFCRCEKLK